MLIILRMFRISLFLIRIKLIISMVLTLIINIIRTTIVILLIALFMTNIKINISMVLILIIHIIRTTMIIFVGIIRTIIIFC